MTRTDKFLALYREYETIVKDRYNMTPLQHQEQLKDERLLGRLTLCRQFRNYLAHNNDASFIEITDVHIKFLEQYVDELSSQLDVAKKHVKSVSAGVCTEKDKCVDVLAKMIKGKMPKILVQTAKGYGIATIYAVSQKALESKTKKMSDVKLVTESLYYAKGTDKMTDLADEGTILVTQTGSADGKLLGVIYK